MKPSVPKILTKVGATVVLELESNPTTGFDWVMKIPEELIRLESKEHVRSADRIGAGGITRFTLRALAPGTATVRGTYERSWEPTPVERRTWTIVVE